MIHDLITRDSAFNRLCETSFRWCWQFYADLTETTPACALSAHGERCLNDDDQRTDAADTMTLDSYANGTWYRVNLDDPCDSDPYDAAKLTTDLLDTACTTAQRYCEYLIAFRRIIESSTTSATTKRQQVTQLASDGRYPDVTYSLGGVDSIISRCLPEYLLYLEDRGVGQHQIQALRLAGINSRWHLGGLTLAEVVSITGTAIDDRHTLYRHWHHARSAVNDLCLDDTLDNAHLKDPIIQTLY